MAGTVLITGISGFIARHVALAALNAGFKVRGTVRSLEKGDKVAVSLARHGVDPARLEFVAADLQEDAGWDKAVEGCDAVLHVASPFPMTQPRDRHALTPAARDGALRVLRAVHTAGVGRVVMTSSMVAVMYRPGRGREEVFGEQDWTDVNWGPLSAYVVSKTEAERAAWNYMERVGATESLTTVNPGLVVGPLLDKDIGTSIELFRMMMAGRYPAIPPVAFPTVDVRDVAHMHVEALARPDTGGRRLLASGGTQSLKELLSVVRETVPENSRKIPSMEVPAFMVRLLSGFDRNLAAVIPDLGTRPIADTSYVEALLGMTFRTPAEAIGQTARSLVALKMV